MEKLSHPFPPVFDSNSKILVLGSFPSVKSRENGFFYGHPQNRFWRVTAEVFGTQIPLTNEEKRRFLLNNGVALWDVLASCEIKGSGDASIKNAVPNDLSVIFDNCKIQAVFANGGTAGRLYGRFHQPFTDIEAKTLPSTSPANASFSLCRLVEEWAQIADFDAMID